MNELAKVNEAVEYIKSFAEDFESDVAIIIGSTIFDYDIIKEIDYKDIPNFPVPLEDGYVGKLILASIQGINCYIMNGRIYSYDGLSSVDIIRPIRILRNLGVKKILLTSAAGAVNLDFEPGELMLITDHVNFGGDNPLKGAEALEFGPRFPIMTNAYDLELQEIIRETAISLDIPLNEGIFLKLSGPSYETPAEVRIARALGADVVGMSNVYDCIAAVQCGLRVAGLSCITNMAAGITEEETDRYATLEVCNSLLSTLLVEVIKKI